MYMIVCVRACACVMGVFEYYKPAAAFFQINGGGSAIDEAIHIKTCIQLSRVRDLDTCRLSLSLIVAHTNFMNYMRVHRDTCLEYADIVVYIETHV